MVDRGHVWLPGGAWLLGGCAWLQGGCIGYDEIWSISRRYASYWNAFLFKILLRHLSLVYFVIQTNEGPIGVV